MKITRHNTFANDIVMIDGFSYTGKCLISRIIENYERVEKQREDLIFSAIPTLYRFNKMDKDAAIATMRLFADRTLYNISIGRGVNYRVSDNSSVWKYPYPLDYIKRVFQGEREIAHERIIKEDYLFHMIGNSVMTNIDLHFDSFDGRIKLIYMTRNPIDIIHGIYNHRFGIRVGTDPTECTYSFDCRKQPVPCFAQEWAKEYTYMEPIDRVVRFVYEKSITELHNYDRIDDRRRQVMLIRFEDLVTGSIPICVNLARFINRTPLKRLPRLLKKENCYRKLDLDDVLTKKREIKKICSKESSRMIEELLDLYDKYGLLKWNRKLL